jgi:hypothetical protein
MKTLSGVYPFRHERHAGLEGMENGVKDWKLEKGGSGSRPATRYLGTGASGSWGGGQSLPSLQLLRSLWERGRNLKLRLSRAEVDTERDDLAALSCLVRWTSGCETAVLWKWILNGLLIFELREELEDQSDDRASLTQLFGKPPWKVDMASAELLAMEKKRRDS